jgi:hypothetical protein
MVPVGTGVILIVLGLVPGLFQGLTDGVRNALESFSSPLRNRLHGDVRIREPQWLAGVGIALIAAAIILACR